MKGVTSPCQYRDCLSTGSHYGPRASKISKACGPPAQPPGDWDHCAPHPAPCWGLEGVRTSEEEGLGKGWQRGRGGGAVRGKRWWPRHPAEAGGWGLALGSEVSQGPGHRQAAEGVGEGRMSEPGCRGRCLSQEGEGGEFGVNAAAGWGECWEYAGTRVMGTRASSGSGG